MTRRKILLLLLCALLVLVAAHPAMACQRDGKDVACEQPIVIIADSVMPIGTVVLLVYWLVSGV